MMKLVAAAAMLALSGCATERSATLVRRGDKAHPLYVGHSDTGDVVVAASHFDAMSGVAVAADTVGGKVDDNMRCSREQLTGTHVPKWVCRYQSEIDEETKATQDWLLTPRVATGQGK